MMRPPLGSCKVKHSRGPTCPSIPASRLGSAPQHPCSSPHPNTAHVGSSLIACNTGATPRCPVLHRSARPTACRSVAVEAEPVLSPEQAARELADLLEIKISVARGTGRLDLTDLRLTEIPAEIFEIHDLEDLAMAGNRITVLPDAIGNLTQLKRLGLTGNRLTSVPASIGKLQQLEGLWLHGNLLHTLPPEIGHLTQLKQLSLAGNCLCSLPDAFGGMQHLDDLSLAGNLLTELPPSIGALGAVRLLKLNGNKLKALPEILDGLEKVEELSLQGNELTQLPESITILETLRELSVADNLLTSLPEGMDSMTALARLWAYGNRLTCVPASLASAPALESIWLEGNPLQAESVRQLLLAMPAMKVVRHVGLDTTQVDPLTPDEVLAAGGRLKVGQMLGTGPGYFKVQLATSRTAAPPRPPTEEEIAAAQDPDYHAPEPGWGNIVHPELLLVSFGSAPGLPNWGTLIRRLDKDATSDSLRAFDVLYVVDPARSWYGGCDPQVLSYYTERLRKYTKLYKRVLMLGDSMGATAALLFAPLATAVLAFCPQVDMEAASIRPGRDCDSLAIMKAAIMDGVRTSDAEITVSSGTWKHDLDQINMLPQDHVIVKTLDVDSHRLTAYLDRQGRLLPLVQTAVKQQLGVKAVGKVRLHNLL